VLFGLSMDYHVFVVSRIREAYDLGVPTRQAVAYGIRSSAGVVTSAAVIMIAVFAVFAITDFITIRELGVALVVAIAIDATVMRLFILPAIMQRCGHLVWWLPRSIDRKLPKLDHEGP